MRFIALFEDRPNTGALRDVRGAFLRQHKGTIVMAGALRATIRVLDWSTAPGFGDMVVGPKTQAV